MLEIAQIGVLDRDAPDRALLSDVRANRRQNIGVQVKLDAWMFAREVFREDWELEGRNAAHVDHVTDDLSGFLEKIAAARA